MFIHGDMGKKSTMAMWDECNQDVDKNKLEPYDKDNIDDNGNPYPYDDNITAKNICGETYVDHNDLGLEKDKQYPDWVKSAPEMWEYSSYAPKKENGKRMHFVSKAYRDRIKAEYIKHQNTKKFGGRSRRRSKRRTLRRNYLHTRRK